MNLEAMIDQAYQAHLEVQRQAEQAMHLANQKQLSETRTRFQKQLDEYLELEVQKQLRIKLADTHHFCAIFDWLNEPWSIEPDGHGWQIKRNYSLIARVIRRESLQESLFIELARAKESNPDIPTKPGEVIEVFLKTKSEISKVNADLVELRSRLEKLEDALCRKLGYESGPFLVEQNGNFYSLSINDSDCKHPVTIEPLQPLEK